jgi:hypothetical protein
VNKGDPVDEAIRLVEVDYERTAKFIESVIGISAAVRGLAITVWLGLVGFAFDRHLWELAAAGLIAIGIFAVVDAYHGWLYDEALFHAQSLELISSAYYKTLMRGPSDTDAVDDFRARLESHSFGLYLNLRKFGFRDLRYARPRIVFRTLYPGLAVISVIAAVLIGWFAQ